MIILPLTYSPSTVARRFSVLERIRVNGGDAEYLVILSDDKNELVAAIIESALTLMDNGDTRHKVVAKLDLCRKDRVEQVLIKDTWVSQEVAQIEGIVVDGSLRDMGFATVLYEAVIDKAKLVLLSDNEQYQGAKGLWQKIARTSKLVSVYVLDTDENRYFPYDGNRIAYDGTSIPEDEIWSTHPDKSKHAVLLVAERNNSEKSLAA